MPHQIFDQALHIVGGVSAAANLSVALELDRDQILVGDPAISCGPCPSIDHLPDWRRVRCAYLQSLAPDSEDTVDWFGPYRSLMGDPERLNTASPVMIWAGQALPDQLLQAETLFVYDSEGIDTGSLHLNQFAQLWTQQDVRSVSALDPRHINEFRPPPHRYSEDERLELRRAWRAYTSADPSDLSAYLDAPGPLPWLHRAMGGLVSRYPDRRTGLSAIDEVILDRVKNAGPNAVRVVGSVLVELFEGLDPISDQVLFQRLAGMADQHLSEPLIQLDGDAAEERSW